MNKSCCTNIHAALMNGERKRLGSGESRCDTGRGCCRVLQRSRTGVYELLSRNERITVSLQCVAVCCSMLQCVAVCQWIHGLLNRE